MQNSNGVNVKKRAELGAMAHAYVLNNVPLQPGSICDEVIVTLIMVMCDIGKAIASCNNRTTNTLRIKGTSKVLQKGKEYLQKFFRKVERIFCGLTQTRGSP